MRLRSLSTIKRTDPGEVILGNLPRNIPITRYALQRAVSISGLVRRIHGDSFEWYGFTLAEREDPECIIDIGLPSNDRNVERYARIGPENISAFQDSLPGDVLINGWIHSHGKINLREFSRVDEINHLTVLDYVATFIKRPVSRREVVVDDLRLFSERNVREADPAAGSVWIVTDDPVLRAALFEIVQGSFCYGLLVGDGGWYRQEIYYRTRGILTGTDNLYSNHAEMLPIDSGRVFTKDDEEALAREIKNRIKPDRHGRTVGSYSVAMNERGVSGSD